MKDYGKRGLIFWGCAVFMLIAFHCAERERSNPLDPQNQHSAGKPSGLKVSAIRDTVSLQWDKIDVNDLTGIKIFRKISTETNFSVLAQVSAGAINHQDTSVTFGVEYNYRISAIGNNYESKRSDVVTIEPGPTFSFFAINDSRLLLKLTHDSRHILKRISGFHFIVDIEYNPKTGEIWTIDLENSLSGLLLRVTPDGELRPEEILLGKPRELAIHEESGDIWVADSKRSIVIKYNSSGQELFKAHGFIQPVTLAVDQTSGDCWIGDAGQQKLIKLSNDGTRRLTSPENPGDVRSVAVDASDGSVWVSGETRVIKLDPIGAQMFEVTDGITEPHKLVTDQNDGSVWVLNWSPSALIKFDRSGDKSFEVNDFSFPEDLAVNRFDGGCLIADTGNNRVVRVSRDGFKVSVVQEIRAPAAVGILNEIL